jgi:hypothetical protein
MGKLRPLSEEALMSGSSNPLALAVTLTLGIGCGGGDEAGPDAGGGETTDAAPTIQIAGRITVTELWMFEMGQQMASASAGFRMLDGQPPPTPIAAEGSCAVYDGSLDDGVGPLAAGDIAVTGGARDIRFTWSGGSYASDLPQSVSELFGPGQTLTAAGAGGADVGPFQVQAAAPNAMTPTAPNFTAGLDLSVASTFHLEWDPGAAGSIFVEIVSQGVTLACAPPNTGSLDIPSSLLTRLPRSSQGGMLMITRSTSEMTTVGGARVELKLESTACTMGRVRD